MKRIFCVLMCALFALGAVLFTGCASSEEQNSEKLAAPVVSVADDGLAYWDKVEGAIGYEYKINDGKATRVGETTTSIMLFGSEKIVVRAIAVSEANNSDWSEEVRTKQIAQLPKPTLNVAKYGDSTFVTWTKDPRAITYMYRLNADEEKEIGADELGIQIGAQDTLYIKAVGDGISYANSDWAIVKPE